MKKFISIIVSVIIVVLFFIFCVFPKVDFSVNENRYLEKVPTLRIDEISSGKYMQKVESYVEDHFPFRENFLNLKTNILKLVGVNKHGDVYYGTDGYLLQEYNEPVNDEKIVNIVNRFVSSFDDVDFKFMLVPTSVFVNGYKLPKNNIVYSQDVVIDYYRDTLNFDFIDVSDELLNNKNEYLYYKTDHHWTIYGAYYAYLEYCREENIDYIDFRFEKVSDDFQGTLYSKVIDDSLDKDSIYRVVDGNEYEVYYNDKDLVSNSMYSEEYLNKKDKYSYFLDNNHDLITIENKNIDNNLEILVIKDSYANCFIPFLANHYKKIHVIDPRYYRLSVSEYINDNNIDEVLFLYNVLTIDDDFGIRSLR